MNTITDESEPLFIPAELSDEDWQFTANDLRGIANVMDECARDRKGIENELLGCPFCGRDSKIAEFFIDDDPTPWYIATCEICPVKTYDQTTATEAARVWNTRA